MFFCENYNTLKAISIQNKIADGEWIVVMAAMMVDDLGR
jgi:hypothetical protein